MRRHLRFAGATAEAFVSLCKLDLRAQRYLGAGFSLAFLFSKPQCTMWSTTEFVSTVKDRRRTKETPLACIEWAPAILHKRLPVQMWSLQDTISSSHVTLQAAG